MTHYINKPALFGLALPTKARQGWDAHHGIHYPAYTNVAKYVPCSFANS